ncbi:60S ribosomal protein L24, partial [Mrakia frigida]|uniref:ribosomal eL24 family protein n=1 Tax=Mrakia frigida TaxID=29902 RepID=UPI003FCC0B44
MKVEICSFSGFKIYPSRGRLYVRGDSKVFRFLNQKSESLFLQRKNPRKIAWTQVYRRMHKKGVTEEVAKKRSRKTTKHARGIVGADLASILAKRTQKPEVRTAARQAAITKAKGEKREKASKPKSAATNAPKQSKQGMKGPKG